MIKLNYDDYYDDYYGDFYTQPENRYGNSINYDWVDKDRRNYSPEERPYGFSDYFIKGNAAGAKKADGADYSDRLASWDRTAWEKAFAKFPVNFHRSTMKDLSEWLGEYFQKPCKIYAVSTGCNVATGYPYFVFWYSFT